MTVLSVAAWWPLYIKYQVVPGFVRFFWWLLVWAPLTAVHHQVHRFSVKMGVFFQLRCVQLLAFLRVNILPQTPLCEH